jgi:chromosome segregation ATPase
MGETSISVTARTLERFNDAKADLNDAQSDVPDHNADSFLNALLDTWEQVGEIPEDGPEAITDALSDDEVAIVGTEAAVAEKIADRIESSDVGDDLREQLDRIEASAATVEERTNQIQRDVEGLQR